MKLLGWMHRKFRKINGDEGMDLASVSACSYRLSGRPSANTSRPNPPPAILRQDLLSAETEPPELIASTLFDGLLYIGTFGSPIEIPENEPPKSEEEATSAIVNELAENEIEMPTESDLIAISVELEKVITAESEKENRSSERLSSASATARPSHAGSHGKISDVCPLQDFLFGATVEAAAKRRRGSLGELFMRSRAAESGGGDENRVGVMLDDKGIVKPAPAPKEMKRLLKCRGSICNGGAAAAKYLGAVTKIQNILRIFQRKIHPENSIAAKKRTKPAKYDTNRDHKCRINNRTSSSRNSINDYGRQVVAPKKADEGKRLSSLSKATGNREQWIKTDADYVVLEL